MAGVYRSVGDPNYRPLGEGEELNNVLRAALISVQHMLRERFENRVLSVRGYWQWPREPAGVAAQAPPLPDDKRKEIAGISRLVEILTNAQFRDQTPHEASHSHKPVTPEVRRPEQRSPYARGRIVGPISYQDPDGGPNDSPMAIVMLVMFVVVIIWATATVILSRESNKKRVKQLKQRIRGWFSKKAAAANEQSDAEPAPPRDDPPPPYFDSTAEPFLPPEGVQGDTLAGGELPPPYSSCETQPDCKATSIDEQLQSLLDRGTTNIDGTGATESDVAGVENGETDDCSANSGREISGDRSHIVVV